ncbi:hypothetical protein RB195_016969 [Necator americanus]
MRQKRKRDRILVSQTERDDRPSKRGGEEHVMAHTAGYAAKLVQPVFIFERHRADVSEEPDSERASDRASAPSPISGPLQPSAAISATHLVDTDLRCRTNSRQCGSVDQCCR